LQAIATTDNKIRVEQLTIENMENQLLKRITLHQNICHGKPCIKGLRYPVGFLIELLSSGMTTEEILADYEDLELEDIQAVLLFAAK